MHLLLEFRLFIREELYSIRKELPLSKATLSNSLSINTFIEKIKKKDSILDEFNNKHEKNLINNKYDKNSKIVYLKEEYKDVA
ncbi:MAG: hypothetical protein ACWA5P_06965 [bacterium]